MAKDGSFDRVARARWLKELGAGLREAERLTTALTACTGDVVEVILLRARIMEAKNSLTSFEAETPAKLSNQVKPLWTISREPFDRSP